MKILIVNHYAGSPRYGMEYRPYYFAKEWIRAGHYVTIVSSSFSHLRFNQPACDRPITYEYIEGINYFWLKTPEYHGNNLKRIVNMISFAMQVLIKTIPFEKPDIVIDSSTYPLTIFGLRKIARKFSAKLIFEVHDLWPLSPMELGGFSKWHPFILVMQYAENYAYKHADRVVSVLPKAKEYMVARGMSPDKFVYIPNGINTSAWQISDSLPEEHKNLLTKLRRRGKFIVGYAGAHGIANALQYFVETARLLKKNDKINFLLVGQGPMKKDLQSFAEREKLNNISFLPVVPKINIPDIFRYVDIFYIAANRNPLYRFGVSPNKMFDYMLAGKPIINAIDAGNDLVTESGCGISVAPEDPQAIADAIFQFTLMSQEERTAMGQRGHEYVKSHHEYLVLAKKFLEGL